MEKDRKLITVQVSCRDCSEKRAYDEQIPKLDIFYLTNPEYKDFMARCTEFIQSHGWKLAHHWDRYAPEFWLCIRCAANEKPQPVLGDPDYKSGHSISADGHCNMGCC